MRPTQRVTADRELKMRVFAHILAEEFFGHWIAWFRNSPESACCGRSPKEVFRRLLEMVGADDFDSDDFILLDQPSPEGHRQFLIAHRRRVVIPSVSRN